MSPNPRNSDMAHGNARASAYLTDKFALFAVHTIVEWSLVLDP